MKAVHGEKNTWQAYITLPNKQNLKLKITADVSPSGTVSYTVVYGDGKAGSSDISRGDNLANIIASIKRKRRTVATRVSVLYTEIDTVFGKTVVNDGEGIGIHATTGDVLARVNGKPTTVSSYSAGVLVRLDATQRKKLMELHEAARRADEAYESFTRPLKFNLHRAVSDAINAACKEEEAVE